MSIAQGYSENFAELANAVIQKGVEDWRSAKRRLLKHELELKKIASESTKYDSKTRVIVQDQLDIEILEKFFLNSEWFEFLPTITGDYLLGMLRKDWEERKPNEIKRIKELMKIEEKKKNKKRKKDKETA